MSIESGPQAPTPPEPAPKHSNEVRDSHEKIEASADLKARYTRKYFEITKKILVDFVDELKEKPWEIEIDAEDDKSLTAGILALQEKLGFEEKDCDGACGPKTHRAFEKAQILNEQKKLREDVVKPPKPKGGLEALLEKKTPVEELQKFADTTAADMKSSPDGKWKERFFKNPQGMTFLAEIILMDALRSGDKKVNLDPELEKFVQQVIEVIRGIEDKIKTLTKNLFPETMETFTDLIKKDPDWKTKIDTLLTNKTDALKLFLVLGTIHKFPSQQLLSPEITTYLSQKIAPQYNALRSDFLKQTDSILLDSFQQTFPDLDWESIEKSLSHDS